MYRCDEGLEWGDRALDVVGQLQEDGRPEPMDLPWAGRYVPVSSSLWA